MGKSLVIVESPAKAKTINKYLGSDFVVKSSVGHVRDLPSSGSAKPVDAKERARLAAESRKLPKHEREARKKERKRQQLMDRMGIYPDENWRAHYQLLTGKEKVVEELKRYAKSADTIYLATDLDREGEAIAWHLTEILGGDLNKYKRVIFNQITKSAIQEAFSKPTELDLNMVNAQQARRFLDRLVGYMVSPLLWEKVARGLSAGRVQSVAVRLIVEREREIRAFIPYEFWTLDLLAGNDQGSTQFEAVRYAGQAYKPVNQEQSEALLAKLQSHKLQVDQREEKPTSSRPAAPFITSTLQQAASTRLGFSVKKTMTLAQRLYEAGYITYMRTDSTHLSAEALDMARSYLQSEFGDAYVPESANFFGSKKNAQEAHEAIRPTELSNQASKLDVEPDARKLYDLIWRRFLASQASDAKFLSTTIELHPGDFVLRARGRIQLFAGHTAILPPVGKDEPMLPNLQVGDQLTAEQWLPKQNFTKPPARYSEAALVKELEKRGIGRPSTYSSIISTIQDRGYVHTEARKFFAEKIGDIVTDRLVENFANLLDYGFTAQMEQLLDEVAEGKREWRAVLDEFYAQFQQQLTAAEQQMRANEPTMTDVDCSSCGRKMMIRTGSTGVFLGCSGYNLPPSERCKTTMDLMPADDVVALDDDDQEAEALRKRKRCHKCGTAMDVYLLDTSRKLHICGNNPDCDGYEIEQGQFKLKGYEGPIIECDKCSSPMELKNGRFGKYFGCTNSECKNTRKVLRNGQPAPPKMDPIPMPNLACRKVEDHYVLRDGAAGLFLAASKFPKNRETRAPLLKELLPVKSQLDPKYHYLLTGPVTDPQGRDSIIRYSRKTQSSYLMSENDQGKASGWSAVYQDGRWVITDKTKS